MIERLRKRRDFLAAARGSKAARRAFVLESAKRGDESGPARFGFTVSKRTAKKAVERNRIRRRLREAVRLMIENPPAGRDYVLVARRNALSEPFAALKAALADALHESANRNPDAEGRVKRSRR